MTKCIVFYKSIPVTLENEYNAQISMKSQNKVFVNYTKLSMKSSMKSFQKVLFSVVIKIEGETERPLQL